MDWGVCANPKSPRAGLLTFEHQGCPEFAALDGAPEARAESTEKVMETKAPDTEADDELAEGAAPLRKLKILEYELADALENAQEFDGETIRTYLDSETGEILQIHSEWEDHEELSDRIDAEPDRYHQIEPLVSRQSFQIMEDFAESLPASSWKSRLIAALSRNKPFRRFRDEVHADLRLRDQWFAFQREALKAHARHWLKSLGIEPQFVREVDPK